MSSLIVLLILISGCANTNNLNQNEERSYKVTEHKIFGNIGENHVANMVARKGVDGYRFTAFGITPITEWVVGTTSKRQVVPDTPNLRYSNGGVVMDITGDGVEELVVARGDVGNLNSAKLYWFHEVEGQEYWDEYMIDDIWEAAYVAPHDIVTYIREDGFRGIIANHRRRDLYLYPVPDDPKGDWERIKIGSFPADHSQSGIEIIDINGNGYKDIVSGMFWVEAPEDPTEGSWEFHRFGEWDEENRWGGMAYHGVADFNGDGELQIVATEAEIPNARLGIFEKNGDPSALWKETILDTGLYAPHSLIVTDINGNGRPDIIVGEMTAGGWSFPMKAHPKIYAYVNQGDNEFHKSILCEGYGVHEMKVFPEPYEGKLMIYGADEIQPQKLNNMNTHLSYWLIEPK